jgi:hypothetical protein
MTKLYVSINGEDIEATGEILTELLATQAAIKAETNAKAAEDKAKEDAKAALLAKLGITEDEAKLLLG